MDAWQTRLRPTCTSRRMVQPDGVTHRHAAVWGSSRFFDAFFALPSALWLRGLMYRRAANHGCSARAMLTHAQMRPDLAPKLAPHPIRLPTDLSYQFEVQGTLRWLQTSERENHSATVQAEQAERTWVHRPRHPRFATGMTQAFKTHRLASRILVHITSRHHTPHQRQRHIGVLGLQSCTS